MLYFKESIVTIAALVVSGFIAPMSSAQDIINIANTKGAQESTYFDSVLGWKVVVGAINGQPAYCAAIKNNMGSELRLGYGSGQWQVAVPYGSRRGEYTGQMDLDGKVKGTYGQSDGQWTFLWLNLGERDAFMNGQQVRIEVGRTSLDYDLSGSSAAVLKVEECVERRIASAPGDGGSQPQTSSSTFVEPYAEVEGWEIVRVTKDAARKKFDHCAAWKPTDTTAGLRFAVTDRLNSYGFKAYGVDNVGKIAPVSVWYDGNKASAEKFNSRLVADHDGGEWFMISESNAEVGSFVDAVANYNEISFAYTTDDKRQVRSFSLKGTKKVVDQMIKCRGY
jgi:hypothetical protein